MGKFIRISVGCITFVKGTHLTTLYELLMAFYGRLLITVIAIVMIS